MPPRCGNRQQCGRTPPHPPPPPSTPALFSPMVPCPPASAHPHPLPSPYHPCPTVNATITMDGGVPAVLVEVRPAPVDTGPTAPTQLAVVFQPCGSPPCVLCNCSLTEACVHTGVTPGVPLTYAAMVGNILGWSNFSTPSAPVSVPQAASPPGPPAPPVIAMTRYVGWLDTG
jgi:hypothetical protein